MKVVSSKLTWFNNRPYFFYFLLASILVHLLIFASAWRPLEETDKVSIKNGPLTVSLVTQDDTEKAQIEEKPVEPVNKPKPKPKRKPKQKPKKVIKKKPAPVKVITQQKSEEPPAFTVPEEMEAPDPKVAEEKPALDIKVRPEKPQVKQDAPVDMMAMIQQKRAARIAAGDPGTINAREIAKETGMSYAEEIEQRRKDNLKSGAGGVFEITTLSWREATFVFKGWTGDYSNAQMQYYSVEARNGGDIRLKIVRRMIALIREYYDGDFQWESHRLHETITLSARPEDNTGLENFLMQEFAMQFDYYLH